MGAARSVIGQDVEILFLFSQVGKCFFDAGNEGVVGFQHAEGIEENDIIF